MLLLLCLNLILQQLQKMAAILKAPDLALIGTKGGDCSIESM